DAFAFQIFGALDVPFAHNAVSKNVLHRTDKNKISIAAQVSADRPFAADDGHAAVAAAHRRGHDARRGDVDELKVEVVLRIEPRFLGEPGDSHGDARCGLQADEFLCAQGGKINPQTSDH